MNKILSLELYKKLYLIRGVEEKIVELYPEDEMMCPMHMSMGQEAVPVGVCAALQEKDQVTATYRSHAPFLAKTGDVDTLFGEIYGKVSGSCSGKGGSMHLSDIEKGYLGSSGIVGSNIPLALGAAYANKYKRNGQIAVAFFGDGALDEGVFWECLNVACLKKLPILFVLEDNGYAVNTPTSERQAFKDVCDIAHKFGCKTWLHETSADVELVYSIGTLARLAIIEKEGPVLLHFKCRRILEHVGIGKAENQTHLPYYLDSVSFQKKRLLKHGHKPLDIQCREQEIDSLINEAVRNAKREAYPQPEDLQRGVFYEG